MTRVRNASAVAIAAALLVACGENGPNGAATAGPVGTPERPRTIEITMVDIAFEPTDVAVRSGETVKFVFDNEGAVEHEATFGDQNEQEEHAVEMREAEGGDMDAPDESEPGHDGTEAGHDDADSDDGHDEAASLLLQPGESGEVTMTFDDPGVTTTIIGCHVPGHWEAGMRVDVTVTNA